MYERFTDRARKVMQLASQEAQRFNHEYIGTEHILLGLVKEGTGVGGHVLKNFDLDLRKIRLEVEKIVQPAPEMVMLGRLPHTPRAKKVIEYSFDEASNLSHNYVGTEHLLLGLLREQEGVAAKVLTNLGLKIGAVRQEVLNLLGKNEEKATKPPKFAPGDVVALKSGGPLMTISRPIAEGDFPSLDKDLLPLGAWWCCWFDYSMNITSHLFIESSIIKVDLR